MADGTPYDAEWLATCDINVMLENKGVGELDAFTASEAQLLQPRGKSTVMLLDTEVDEIDLEGAWFAHFGSVYFVDRPEDYNDIYSPEDWEKMMLKVRVAAGAFSYAIPAFVALSATVNEETSFFLPTHRVG